MYSIKYNATLFTCNTLLMFIHCLFSCRRTDEIKLDIKNDIVNERLNIITVVDWFLVPTVLFWLLVNL